MTIGFDFGTTNSLVSVVVGDRVIDVLDDEGLPHPSVVRYEGEEVIVGRAARQALENAGIGVHGNTVRSPKFRLGQEVLMVGGVERNPIDIVADVIRHVRSESLRSPQRQVLGALDRAVVTIPVNMDGRRRADLREAYARSGVSVSQFVHEPLAALYGYIRGSKDPAGVVRALMRRHVLVVDWGGGTLDLTLCRLEPDRILQLRNGGTEHVGGDKFDQVIRDEVVKRFSLRHNISETDVPEPEARLRLLQDTERNKIELSQRPTVTFYRPGYFAESGTTLEYRLSREELEEITRPLVTTGIREVEALLDSVGMAPAEVSLCIVAGGMAAMPAIRSQLHEMFGNERVDVPANSATLVSQGAAWISHDKQRLVLAKPVELEMARGSHLRLLRAGTPMPADNEVKKTQFHLFCTDPTDGYAKFPIVAPTELLSHPQASSPRTTIGLLEVEVNRRAPRLFERLELDVEIDHDLILGVTATSSHHRDTRHEKFFDLEFGIGLPVEGPSEKIDVGDAERTVPRGGLVTRTNVADREDESLVPGDVLHAFRPAAFSPPPMPNRATEEQFREHLFYEPCAVCKRAWGDPECTCDAVA